MGIIEQMAKHFDSSKIDIDADIANQGLLFVWDTILVRKDLSNDNKIKTVIHELLHHETRYGGPFPLKAKVRFIPNSPADTKYYKKLYRAQAYLSASIKMPIELKGKQRRILEEAIDREMEDIYRCQPRLVQYLEHHLGLESHSWVQRIIDKRNGQRYLFDFD